MSQQVRAFQGLNTREAASRIDATETPASRNLCAQTGHLAVRPGLAVVDLSNRGYLFPDGLRVVRFCPFAFAGGRSRHPVLFVDRNEAAAVGVNAYEDGTRKWPMVQSYKYVPCSWNLSPAESFEYAPCSW